jgi:predicted RNase H-related nuclease YkuK (DUF458 family)
MESEIVDNLKDRIDVETIKKILNENKSSLSININTDSPRTKKSLKLLGIDP